jgi:predicted permease
VLGVAVEFLLLICCANVASRLLARGVSRETQIAIRRSLGAGRGRILQQLLTESLLLAFAGGGAGVLLAFWLLPGLSALTPIQATALGPWLTDFRIDGRVLLFSFAITVLTGSLFGLAPALKAAGSNGLMSTIKQAEHHAGAGKERRRSLSALVVGEVALATTLLVGGGLVAQSFHRLQSIDLGFRPDGLLTMELPLSPAKYRALSQQVDFIDQVLQRVRTLPGVLAAGITTNVPMQRGTTLDSVFEVEGRAPPRPSEVPITAHRVVSPGYAEALGVTLLKGRLLDANGRGLPVAVVSAELAQQSWPGEDPDRQAAAARPRGPAWSVDDRRRCGQGREGGSLQLPHRAACLGTCHTRIRSDSAEERSVCAWRSAQVRATSCVSSSAREHGWSSAGLALGAAGGWVLTRLLEANLYGVGSTDPATFVAIAVLLCSVALLACFLPARRASRIEPMAALRPE